LFSCNNLTLIRLLCGESGNQLDWTLDFWKLVGTRLKEIQIHPTPVLQWSPFDTPSRFLVGQLTRYDYDEFMEIGVSSDDTPGSLESSRGRVSLLLLAALSVYGKKNKDI
jgi:hypothetical protein